MDSLRGSILTPAMFLTPLLFITLFLQQTSSEEDALVDYKSLFPSSSPRIGLTFPDLVAYDGYKCETHYVTTEDDYILTVYHIHPNANCTKIKKLPVVLMHGLYLCSDDFIIPGPGIAIAYLCADACYHVWLGNNRGNKHARNHTTLNPDTDEEFWDFDYDKMALKDMPAIIDFVLYKSGQIQIYYIGHSQGFTVIILLCAQIAEFNTKIKSAIGLSTASWLDHSRLLAVDIQAILSPATLLKKHGEIFAHGGATQQLVRFLCGTSRLSYPLCSFLIFAVFGYNNGTISQATLEVAVDCEPAGTSIGDFLRWGQTRANGFAKFDYGGLANLRVYGQLKPPIYDLRNYTVPSKFFTSWNDYVSHPYDVDTLLDHLPNCANCSKYIMPNELIGHVDYIYSDLIPTDIKPPIFSCFNDDE